MDIMEQLNAFWPIILMVVIFYFLLWRPQKKQQKKRQEMLESLKPGAKIVTVGGVMGNIVSLHDDTSSSALLTASKSKSPALL